MKWGIISDTHDNLPLFRRAIDFFNKESVKMILHAGDFVSPFTARVFERFKGKFIGVFGNNDGDKFALREFYKDIGEIYEDFFMGEIDKRKVLLIHKEKLVDFLAKSGEFDVLIYGHTHKKEIKRIGKTLIINPGECSGWLTGESTIALLDPKTLEVKIISL